MLEIVTKRFGFKTKTIWFSDTPFDVSGYDGVFFRSCKKDVEIKGFFKQKHTTLVIDLTQDLDEIWEKLKKDSCKRRINRAYKEGITTTINQSYSEFTDLVNIFRNAKGLPPYNITIEDMKKNGALFISELGGEILGGHFFYSDNNNYRSLMAVSKRLDVTTKGEASLIGCANRQIIWEAIKYAKECGIKEFDMGGYYAGDIPDPQKESINDFKKSFGGALVEKYNYHRSYSILYSLGEYLLNKGVSFDARE